MKRVSEKAMNIPKRDDVPTGAVIVLFILTIIVAIAGTFTVVLQPSETSDFAPAGFNIGKVAIELVDPASINADITLALPYEKIPEDTVELQRGAFGG